jgi:hypothetical protein
MPAEAQRSINKYEVSLEMAKMTYDSAVAKARAQVIKELKPVQLVETKNGNLDGAMLIKMKLESLTAESIQPGDSKIDSRIIGLAGRWRVTVPGGNWSGTWEFKDDGTVVRLDSPTYFGKITIDNKDKVVVTWDFEVNTMRLPTKRGVMEGFCSVRPDKSGGNPMRFERMDGVSK